MFNESETAERLYLKHILERIMAAIGAADISVRERVQTLDEQKRYIWENRDIDPQEIRSVREDILNIHATGESVISRKARLERMLDNPYFGRIDFSETSTESGLCSDPQQENGSCGEPVPLYIGVHAFSDFDSRTNFVYDWRAPIASMYYDCELGPAAYTSPAREVAGDISLKRQYRIRGGQMEFMLESSVTVHDEVLQRELGANASERMRNIVATIQREQNRIIRDTEARTLIIQGVAGSGKTSIALHRIAYLLYAHKDTLSSKDILIVSPNKVFADYISNVLPELGEESVPETGMTELLSGVLGGKYRYQTFFEQVAELSEKPAQGFAERIAFKSTLEFAAALDRFILHLENNCFRAADLKIRHITIPHEYIGGLFGRFHRLAIRERFEPMAAMIADELDIKYGIVPTTAERNFMKREIGGMFASGVGKMNGGNMTSGGGRTNLADKRSGAGDLQLYRAFFEWLGRPEMLRLSRGNTLEYSDLAPLAYMRIVLDGIKPNTRVRHLLIDEMQDYSPVQYRVIQRLFACRKTLLGDAGQSIDPHGSSTAETIGQIFAGSRVMKLCKSYRSSREITEFAQRIRRNGELEPVARHGEKPQIVSFKTPEAELAGIMRLISDFRNSEYKSLGVICKTERQAAELYDRLRAETRENHDIEPRSNHAGVSLLTSRSTAFSRGVVITSTHLAKGLEFDEVIVPHATAANYYSEMDRRMLYIAATRAMHRLTLTHCGTGQSFVE